MNHFSRILNPATLPAPMRRTGAAKKRQSGVALMMVLLFIVLLTVIVVEFAYDAQVDASLASTQDSHFEAHLAARSAVAEGLALLAEDLDPEMLAEQELMITGVAGGEGNTGASDPQFDVGRMDLGSGERWAIGVPFEPVNEATRRTTISDEYGKINLNALVYFDEESNEMVRNEPLIAALLSFFSARIENEDAAALVDPIIDWLDYEDDDSEEPEGAEASYYEGLEIPYAIKNGPMDTIEELLLVKGMTAEFYYGDPTLDPPQLPLSECLTVHGAPNGAVNINSAQEEVRFAIMQAYQEAGYNFPAELVPPYSSYNQLQQQVESPNRQGRNNRNRNRNRNVDSDGDGVPDNNQNEQQNPNQAASPFITWSNCFRIYGDGQHGDTLVRIEAYVWRAPWPEDQFITETLTPAQQQRWQDILANAETTDRAANEFEQFRILDWRVIQ